MVFQHHIVDHSWTFYYSPSPTMYVSSSPDSFNLCRASPLRPKASPLRQALPDVFACQLRLFARLRQMSSPVSYGSSPGFARCLRLPASSLRQASLDCPIGDSHLAPWGSSIQSMTEGGVPNSSPSESLSILGGAMTSTSSPEAPRFGLRPIASLSVEARVSSDCLLNSGPDIEVS